MRKKTLEARIRSFFTRYQTPSERMKARMKAEAMASFRATQNRRTLHKWVFWRRTSFSLLMVFCVAVVGLFSSSLTPNRVKAGKIQAEYGPVEIIRGEKSFLVRDEADVFVGDLVRVGNRGIAKLDLKNQGISTIDEKTHLRVTDVDAIFIEKGRLASEAFKGLEVATDRGFVRTTPGAVVLLEVSETGETKVSPEKNMVQVFDLLDGEALLGKGQSLTLSSDTQLSNVSVPVGLSLSVVQLEALRSKLDITRSKLVGAVEQQLQGKRKLAQEDFLSAEATFKSLTQVLLSSRQLEIAHRKNLDDIAISEVYDQLAARITDSGILAETEMLALTFAYFQDLEESLSFKLVDSGDLNLDRYLLLKKIAETETGPTKLAFESLAAQYVVNFLQAIQNEPLLADQIVVLESKVSALPGNAETYLFLRRVGQKMSPDLATALELKMIDHF